MKTTTSTTTTTPTTRTPVLKRRRSDDYHEIDPTTAIRIKGDAFGEEPPPAPPDLANTPKIEESWFIEDMADVWTSRGNEVSAELIEEWRVLLEAFNNSLLDTTGTVYTYNGTCGIGKSQAAQVACADLAANYYHPGFTRINSSWGAILIVERIQTAEETAKQINLLYQDITGRTDACAIAKHSQSDVSFDDIYNFPILVICHQAYSNSLQRLSDGNDTTMRSFTKWRYGQRRLVIVDESINPITEYQLTLQDYNRVHGYFVQNGVIPRLKQQHPQEWAVFEAIGPVLEQIELENKAITIKSDSFRQILENAPSANLQRLYDTLLKDCAWDLITTGRESASLARDVRSNIKTCLQAIDRLVTDWSYSTKSGKFQKTNAANWLISDEVGSMVILDGTAAQDLTYTLFPKRVEVKSNKALRNLENATLHSKRTNANLGKSGFSDASIRVARAIELYEWLKTNLDPDRRVLVVSHQNLETVLMDLSIADPHFQQFDTTHWGATTGENRWSDFDTVVIASCFYRPREWAANAICSQPGLAEGLEHLNHREKTSLVESMVNSKVAVEMIQAFYRCCIRRVIDVEGRCHKADLFVLLPSDERGDQIEEMILAELPNVKVSDWIFSGFEQTRKPRGTDQLKEAAFLRALEDLPTGKTPLGEFLELVGISSRAWKKTWRCRFTGDHPISDKARSLGISLTYSGFGRAQKTFLERSETQP
ncbi:hypothetical protein KBZ08_13535 [Cyanobium sp. Candia 9D4]|uniref:hypothetical protein n=1 Tax=Cyanobium sp. Candia 9D4 TaxID=2823707 RepID=UPI0020CC39BE|nr:hypothetical protein [Cyanobium sp. Candia 9D4]MCP9934937.1 hypothetical protein [Cyanobium sp. Candia 9D4]